MNICDFKKLRKNIFQNVLLFSKCMLFFSALVEEPNIPQREMTARVYIR